MKIGICTGNNPERAKIAGEAGFDFAGGRQYGADA